MSDPSAVGTVTGERGSCSHYEDVRDCANCYPAIQETRIAARDAEIARLRSMVTNQEQLIDTGVCGWQHPEDFQWARDRVAQLEAALRKHAVEIIGSETDLASKCRICGARGPFNGEPDHAVDCLLRGSR